MKNNKLIFITILLLTIGFAAVSTSLIINGNISFNTNEIMPSHDGTSTMTGNSGNGYAKITLISLN